MSGHTGGRVCCPSNGHVLPGQEEDDATVAGCWIKKTHVVRAGVDPDEREMFQTFKHKEKSDRQKEEEEEVGGRRRDLLLG